MRTMIAAEVPHALGLEGLVKLAVYDDPKATHKNRPWPNLMLDREQHVRGVILEAIARVTGIAPKLEGRAAEEAIREAARNLLTEGCNGWVAIPELRPASLVDFFTFDEVMWRLKESGQIDLASPLGAPNNRWRFEVLRDPETGGYWTHVRFIPVIESERCEFCGDSGSFRGVSCICYAGDEVESEEVAV